MSSDVALVVKIKIRAERNVHSRLFLMIPEYRADLQKTMSERHGSMDSDVQTLPARAVTSKSGCEMHRRIGERITIQ